MAANVVVITGASSGIGKATALAFARAGARLALCARDSAALEQSAQECRSVGAETIVYAADVVDCGATQTLRDRAVAAFGRIDIWVNCAAILALGRFEDTTPEMFRRIIETNILGCANGARAALAQFRAQGHRGMLINVSSVLGLVGEPYVSAYVATKFAIRGLTACLRQEVRKFPDIRIMTVIPFAVDTPIYQKAGNVFGRKARSIFPVYSANTVADGIVRASERPRRELVVGLVGKLISLAQRAAPMLLERLVGRVAPRLQFQDRPQAATDGNIFAPTGPHTLGGGWQRYWKRQLRS